MYAIRSYYDLDPLGTIMIFLVHFGWAKPVPVNPSRLGNPKKDMLWISAAGPLANMVLALASGLLIRVLLVMGNTPDRHTAIGLLFFILIMSVITSYSIHYTKLYDTSAYQHSRAAGSVNGKSEGVITDQYQAGFDAGWELDIFGGVRRAIRITSYNVCYTKLLRWAHGDASSLRRPRARSAPGTRRSDSTAAGG